MSHRIAAIPGDGIGKEVVPEGLRVVEAAARRFNIDLKIDHFDFASCDYFGQHGQMMPDDWKDQIGGHEAIFYGAKEARRKGISVPCSKFTSSDFKWHAKR